MQRQRDSEHASKLRLPLRIPIEERFPNLRSAPIVEAAIEVKARAIATWSDEASRDRLLASLPDYGSIDQLVPADTRQDGIANVYSSSYRQSFGGLLLEGSNGLHVAKMSRFGFTFSRLKPYLNWEHLLTESMRLWRVYHDIAAPAEIERISLRYINRISLPYGPVEMDEYLIVGPRAPAALPVEFAGFMYQDWFELPGQPYLARVIKTIQPGSSEKANFPSLLVDIDVSTAHPMPVDRDSLPQRLVKMRWLKNKIFFGSMTAQALETFK
jgi:uncharacterized protein (TIGR04255 family)